MSNNRKILLVEGEADKGLFKPICKKLNLDATVNVSIPRDINPDGFNTKGGVFSQLEILLNQLDDGTITNIAAVVDADYIEHGSGREKTIEQAKKTLEPFGFRIRVDSTKGEGIYFDHDDGLPTVGIWIMVNATKNEGMLEDWIKACIVKEEDPLYLKAYNAVDSIESPKFSEHSKVKAEVATWLAWQKKPGHGFYYLINNDLLNEEKEEYVMMCRWLKNVF